METKYVPAARTQPRTTHGAKGVLFLLDPLGKQVMIEIGYDLEPIFTDGFTGYIERRQMTPFFQANKVGPGIEATIELLVGKALGKIETLNYAKPEYTQQTGRFLSGGGGSRSDVEIGSKSIEKEASPLAKKYQTQTSIQDTLDKYIEVLQLHIKDPNLGIYTPATRKFSNIQRCPIQVGDSSMSLPAICSQRQAIFILFDDLDLY